MFDPFLRYGTVVVTSAATADIRPPGVRSSKYAAINMLDNERRSS
jgi:hypothetical protein